MRSGWTVVSSSGEGGSRSRRRAAPMRPLSADAGRRQQRTQTTLAASRTKGMIEAHMSALKKTAFFSGARDVLLRQAPDTAMDIVCYGLGSPCGSPPARWQLAFAMLLRQLFSRGEPLSLFAYDPLFSEPDRQILKELRIEVIGHNEEGKRKAHPDKHTLFFMPHCGRAMYNNVLWANWEESLLRISVLGNSFKAYIDRMQLVHSLRQSSSGACIQQLAHLTQEVSLSSLADQSSDLPTGVFNDLSLHWHEDSQEFREFLSQSQRPPEFIPTASDHDPELVPASREPS